MSQLETIYLQFLNNFPLSLRPVVSIILAVLIVYSIFKIIKHDFIFLIVLIILLPASIPIFENVWQSILALIQFLLNNK